MLDRKKFIIKLQNCFDDETLDVMGANFKIMAGDIDVHCLQYGIVLEGQLTGITNVALLRDEEFWWYIINGALL